MSDQLFNGKLKFVDLEGGLWYLITETTTYLLDTTNLPSTELKNGHPVTFKGEPGSEYGIGMLGNPTLKVTEVL